MKKFDISILTICVLLFFSCSSTPERPMRITTVSDTAAARYESANSELSAGRYDLALLHFNQAYNLAFSVDDSDLLCRVALSGISYKIIIGNLDVVNSNSDNFIESLSAENILSDAKYFAERTSRKNTLSSICSIYDVEISLARGKKNYAIYAKLLHESEANLQKEPYYLAHLYRTLGDVSINSKSYDAAIDAYKKASEIHTKNRYIMEIGTDWYGVARSYSLSGDKTSAISAMENALKFDRDSENSSAIASDYFACAKILMKGKVSLEDKKLAKSYAKWASSIFKASGMKTQSELCEKFLREIE